MKAISAPSSSSPLVARCSPMRRGLETQDSHVATQPAGIRDAATGSVNDEASPWPLSELTPWHLASDVWREYGDGEISDRAATHRGEPTAKLPGEGAPGETSTKGQAA